MATYYVRADGTQGTFTSATGPESTAANCMTMATFNSGYSALNPGDTVVVSGLGGIHRSIMWAYEQGTSGSEITIEGSNSPEICGADLITGWTVYSGSVWQATVTTEPEQVWIDGSFGDRKASAGACVNALDWYWSSSTLYLYAPGDPDTTYTSPGVEAAQRNHCIELGSNSDQYVIIDGITCSKTNYYCIASYNGGNITVRNCMVEWAWWHGIAGEGTSARDNWLVEDNVCRYCGIHGITLATNCQDSIIRRNECYECGTHQDTITYGGQTWLGGIKIVGDACSGIVIEQNYSHDNGFSGGGYDDAVGIWVDLCNESNVAANVNTVRHNLVTDNYGIGIFIEASCYVDVYGNVTARNGANNSIPGNDIWQASEIRLDSRESYTNANNKIYNNTCVDGLGHGISVTAYSITDIDIANNIFRNNIVVGSAGHALYARYGGDNDGTNGSGNVYDNNCFGSEASAFISWGGTDYSTYDAWLSASSQTDNNIESDPLLTDPNNDDFTLRSGSPCIGAGANLGADYDDALMPSSTWPDGVVTGDQDDY